MPNLTSNTEAPGHDTQKQKIKLPFKMMKQYSLTKQNNKPNINIALKATSDIDELLFQIINTFDTKTVIK